MNSHTYTYLIIYIVAMLMAIFYTAILVNNPHILWSIILVCVVIIPLCASRCKMPLGKLVSLATFSVLICLIVSYSTVHFHEPAIMLGLIPVTVSLFALD